RLAQPVGGGADRVRLRALDRTPAELSGDDAHLFSLRTEPRAARPGPSPSLLRSPSGRGRGGSHLRGMFWFVALALDLAQRRIEIDAGGARNLLADLLPQGARADFLGR